MVFQTAHGSRRDADRNARHARRLRLAGRPRDAHRTDLGRARGRDGRQAAVAEDARLRARRHGPLHLRARLRHARRRRLDGGTAARDRRRRLRALHRARCDRAAARSPARPRRRPAGRPPRRRRRAPGAGERRAQPGPDGLDRRRADDRADARLVRRGLRQGPARQRRDCAPQAAGYEPRDHVAERLGHRSPRRRQGCERGSGRRARLVDPQRPRAARRRRRGRRQRRRPGDDRAVPTTSSGSKALRRRLRRWRVATPSSARARATSARRWRS